MESWVRFIYVLLCCAASDKRHGNINGHLRTTSFETAMPTPHTSGRRPRGGSLPNPSPLSLSPSVLSPACPVCEVIRVDFQHPNLSDGSSSGSRSREGSGKTLRQVYFQVELGKKYVCTTAAVVLQAISGTAIRQVYFQVENWAKIIFFLLLCCKR